MSASRRHAWENYEYAAAAEAPFEDSDDETAPASKEEAGANLADLLIRLRMSGVLSAKQACVIAWWASQAGAVGPCADFGCAADKNSGFYQRRLDRYLQVGEPGQKFYFLDIPGHDRSLATRCVHRTEVIPPHEALAEEVAKNPGLLQRVQRSEAGTEWSETYKRHPAVTTAPAGEPVLPVALYLDGVPYSKSDGFLAIWCYNLLSWQRHLLCVMRKSTMCACGCRRWCSLWPVFDWLVWSFGVLATGRSPTARHDGSPWQAEDAHRATESGRPCVRAAVCLLKGDWSEFTNTLGLPTWQSNDHPCLFCRVRKDRMFDITNFSVLSFPAPLKTTEGYRLACEAAEKHVVATQAQVQRILGALRFDKRKDGAHGRALIRDIPELNLEKGDRLEPSRALRDVGALESVTTFPIELTFWSQDRESWTKHRNPLLDEPTIGMGIEIFAVDTLHTLNLGVYQKMVAKVFWSLLARDIFYVAQAAGGRANMDETIQNGVLRLRLDLQTWYDSYDAQHGVKLNRLDELTIKTLGDRHALTIHCKAAVARPLVLYAADLVQRFAHKLPADEAALVPAARTLAQFSDLVRSVPQSTPPEQVQQLHDLLKRYIVLADRAGIPAIPKLHLAMHLVHRTWSRNTQRECNVLHIPNLAFQKTKFGFLS